MAYTNAWSVTVPAGTELANTIDDHLRRLRLDLQERMNDIVVDWSADPVALNPISLPIVMKNGGFYAASAPAGTRASTYTELSKVLSFILFGDADSAGTMLVDLDEWNTPYESANYYHVDNIIGVSVTPITDSALQGRRASIYAFTGSGAANQLGFMFHGVADGLPVGAVSVTAYVTLFFNG